MTEPPGRLLRPRTPHPGREQQGGATHQRSELTPSDVGHGPSSYRGVTSSNRQSNYTLSLPQSGLQVLGIDLNCSESDQTETAVLALADPGRSGAHNRHV